MVFDNLHLFDCRRKRTNEGGGAGKLFNKALTICATNKVSLILMFSLLIFFIYCKNNVETPGDQIVRKLTFERIEELKKSIRNDQLTYK